MDVVLQNVIGNSPNDGFIAQLTIFQETLYQSTSWNKVTRAFYLGRVAREIISEFVDTSEKQVVKRK
jgi:hypothetical protein